MTATVAVIGGGIGGVGTAKRLDDVADVVLIEPRDTFFYNIAALRGVVDPRWTDRLFLPYDRLLGRGRVLRDRAVRVTGTEVTLGSGDRIAADFIVLATGSTYPYPAKIDINDDEAAKAKIRATREALTRAGRILLLGAGSVGLEFAGEIKAAWPEKSVAIVDPAEDLLSGLFPEEFDTELRRQLDELGVELLLGTSLLEAPPSDPGVPRSFTATTRSGKRIPADIWFRCFGVAPVTDYLDQDLSAARQPGGLLGVTPQLRLVGQDRVFAIGDVTAIPEGKTARAAGQHAEVVAANIRSLINGSDPPAGYEPQPPGIALPLGPAGGVSYAAGRGFFGAEMTSRIKGADLRLGIQLELMGLK